jgi:cytochrome c biogenesis protein CcdA
MVGAAVAGSLVTLLEAVCTGQVYVPILAALSQPEYKERATGLLAVYNAGFIAPLLVVIAVAYYGVTSEQLAKVSRRNLVLSKVLMALLLIAVAAVLVVAQRY